MRMRTFFPLSALLFAFAGCSRVPNREIDTARQSIEAAKAADADLFAHDRFTMACDLFDSAAAAINVEQQKLPLSANYERAQELLEASIREAGESINQSRSSRKRQRIVTDSLLERAREMIAEARSGLATTRRVGPVVRDSLRHVTDSATVLAKNAEAAYGQKNLADAADGANRAIATVMPVWRLAAPRRDTTKSN